MIHSLKRLALAFALIGASCVAASAHPHVWVKATSAVVYGPDGSITGIRHAWAFDDMYSAFATQGLEQKKKGEFTREELQPLAQVNVESLKEYDFFTFAKANGQDVEFVDPKEYHLEYDPKETVLTLYFVLPVKTPFKAKQLKFEVFDPTYFVDFALAEKNPIGLENAPAGCAFDLNKPKQLTAEMAQRLAEIPADGTIPPDSYGEAFANTVTVKCP